MVTRNVMIFNLILGTKELFEVKFIKINNIIIHNVRSTPLNLGENNPIYGKFNSITIFKTYSVVLIIVIF